MDIISETVSLMGCLTSQDPQRSRGLGKALEGHDTDNAPKGAANGSANCIADSWPAPEGAIFMPWNSCYP